ncbi:MAG: polysaccharide biosynthesis/export family protein [Chitinophagaceae bacterium]
MRSRQIGFSLLSGLLLSLALVSCSEKQFMKETPYFGDVSDSTVTQIAYAQQNQLKIQPDDILNITLQLTDPVANSNLNNVNGAAQTAVAPNASSGQFLIGGGQTSIGSDGVGFLVDKEGKVNLPVFGKIQLEGLTTDEARAVIQNKADSIYKYATVNIRFVNNKIGVLGEVNRPGYYYMGNEKNTILDALLMAGDLTIYGKRTNIILMRDSAGSMTMRRFNLNSKDLVHQPYFFLKQRDVIYVEPNKAKIQSLNSPVYTKIGLGVSIVTMLILLWTKLD